MSDRDDDGVHEVAVALARIAEELIQARRLLAEVREIAYMVRAGELCGDSVLAERLERIVGECQEDRPDGGGDASGSGGSQ